ncbi:Integrin linked kinase associated, partial [Paragonimus heterotremus]
GLAQIEKDIKRVFYDAFKKTDGDFLREACQQRPHWRDGSTASVVLLVNNTLYIANLGDSKVVLAREVEETVNVNSTKSTADSGNPKSTLISAVSLTRDHNPMDYEERQRIQATGATVQNGRVNNILEVSRSFGDYQFKKQGVTCLPDVRKCQLTAHDRFVLIACDGLWKSFPPEEAVALTNRLLMKELESGAVAFTDSKTNSTSSSTVGLTQRHLDSVCSHLVNEAVLRMSGDNVTCILLVFPTAFMSRKGNANADGNGYQTQNSAHLLSSHISVQEPPTKVLKLT